MLARIRKLLSPDSSTRTVAEIEAAQAEVRAELKRLQTERTEAQATRKARILEADAKELRSLEGKAADLSLEIERLGVVLERLDAERAEAQAREREEARAAYEAALEEKAARGRELIQAYAEAAPALVAIVEELDRIDTELEALRRRQSSEHCPDRLKGVQVPLPPSVAARSPRVPRLPQAAVIPPASPDAPSWLGSSPSIQAWDAAAEAHRRKSEAHFEQQKEELAARTADLARRGYRLEGVQVVEGPDGRTFDLSEAKEVRIHEGMVRLT